MTTNGFDQDGVNSEYNRLLNDFKTSSINFQELNLDNYVREYDNNKSEDLDKMFNEIKQKIISITLDQVNSHTNTVDTLKTQFVTNVAKLKLKTNLTKVYLFLLIKNKQKGLEADKEAAVQAATANASSKVEELKQLLVASNQLLVSLNNIEIPE